MNSCKSGVRTSLHSHCAITDFSYVTLSMSFNFKVSVASDDSSPCHNLSSWIRKVGNLSQVWAIGFQKEYKAKTKPNSPLQMAYNKPWSKTNLTRVWLTSSPCVMSTTNHLELTVSTSTVIHTYCLSRQHYIEYRSTLTTTSGHSVGS